MISYQSNSTFGKYIKINTTYFKECLQDVFRWGQWHAFNPCTQEHSVSLVDLRNKQLGLHTETSF